MLPIPVWKCDALEGIPMLCGGMNMPGGSIAGDTWVLWLAERMSVFADKLSQTGFREGHGVGRTASKAGRIRWRVLISFRAELRPREVHDASRDPN